MAVASRRRPHPDVVGVGCDGDWAAADAEGGHDPLRRGSMRETVPEYVLATQTEPPATAIADGPLPTGIVATTKRASIDARDGGVEGVGDPDSIVGDGQAAGPLPT